MLVKFKQAVYLAGKEYSKGTHSVSEAVLAHKFFHKLIKAGLVEDGEAVKTAAPLSLEERQKMILEKSAAAAAAVQKNIPTPASTVVGSSSPSQVDDSPVGSVGGDETPPAPSEENAPAAKSDEDLMAEMEAEESAQQAEQDKSKAESSKKNKQKK